MDELNSPSFSESISMMIESALASCHIGMPAKVVTYDAAQQRVSVKPIIRRSVTDEAGERTALDYPIIEGVPVKFPGAGDFAITFPLAKGDLVWLDFGEGSLDKWLSTGAGDVDPADDRRNALSDATATPGIRPFSDPTLQVHATDMVIGAPGIRLGSKDATQAALHGDAYASAESTYLDALAVYLAAIVAALPVPGALVAATTVYTSADTAFRAATTAAKSAKIKVE